MDSNHRQRIGIEVSDLYAARKKVFMSREMSSPEIFRALPKPASVFHKK